MQSPRSLHIPSFHSAFPKHSSDNDCSRFSLDLRVSTKHPTPYWASLPSPPMSGSPPSEHPVEPPQLAGHRRKRSDTPQEAPFATPVSEPSSGPGTAEIHSIQQQTAPVSTTARPLVPPYSSSYPSTQRYDYGTAGPPPMGTSATAAESQPRQGEVSPRITRKTKAHVASACMNCKKKHLRCDNARPCRRCVQSGKEVT